MNGFTVFLGVFAAMAISWYGILFKNYHDFNRLKPEKLPLGGNYPGGRSGTANAGQEVYKANGCASCHTMQVRMNTNKFAADIERHWGRRNSTLQDFLYDQNVFLGQVRIGPDLADVGTRLPDRNYHLLHLYDPRITQPGSLMPRYAYLFQKRKLGREPSPHAVRFPATFSMEPGYEIIPTHEAETLVAYLMSLHATESIFSAPIFPPPPETNEVAAATNSINSAAGTNSNAAPSTNQ